jgi:hypothetical protein
MGNMWPRSKLVKDLGLLLGQAPLVKDILRS